MTSGDALARIVPTDPADSALSAGVAEVGAADAAVADAGAADAAAAVADTGAAVAEAPGPSSRTARPREPEHGPTADHRQQSEKAVRAVNVVRIYGKDQAVVRAVDGVNLSFERGCFTAVMGPSGSGKSTLLHCLAGLDQVTSGQVFLGDLELSSLGEAELTKARRDRIGFIFQSFNLIPTLTAEENITLPLAIASRRPDQEWMDHVVDRLGLRPRLTHRPAEMSGGQQQRVAAARALVSRPEVVFADEPAGNLDQRAGGELLELLSWMVHEVALTIVMVTHDPGAAGHKIKELES
jgi:putative ABC transport system ATP-binding protein